MNKNKKTKLTVVFFVSDQGKEPVRDWLKNLDKDDKKRIGEDIMTVQYGWPLGMPLVDSLGSGLWEVRISLRYKRIARVIFILDQNYMILLHGFMKKTQKTPKPDLELARKRKQLYERSIK